MKQILLVLEREYLVRVRKKSFIIMTLLGPLLISAFYGMIIWITMSQVNGEQKSVQVYDASGLLVDEIKSNEHVLFGAEKVSVPYEEARDSFLKSNAEAMVYIPPDFRPFSSARIKIASRKDLGLNFSARIESSVNNAVKNIRLKEAGLRSSTIDSLDNKPAYDSDVVNYKGESKISGSAVKTGAGIMAAVVIYMFIFIYGAMVMRGVLEEKTNRIVEIIITSVKPFNLMMGKILGIALVGVTQLLVWGILSSALIFLISLVTGFQMDTPEYAGAKGIDPEATNEFTNFFAQVGNENWWRYFFFFIFYFTGGYLIYSALFAAIAAAVDAETDTQQFMLPISIPLIMGLVVAQTGVMSDPNSTLAVVFSMIPLTSPVVMIARLPFVESPWEILASMALLALGFVVTVYLAGRIYRTGILMYGKKATYKELFKWLFYKY